MPQTYTTRTHHLCELLLLNNFNHFPWKERKLIIDNLIGRRHVLFVLKLWFPPPILVECYNRFITSPHLRLYLKLHLYITLHRKKWLPFKITYKDNCLYSNLIQYFPYDKIFYFIFFSLAIKTFFVFNLTGWNFILR